MPIPAPATDLSGGFLVVKYSGGGVSHKLRLHVCQFSASTGLPYAAGGLGTETDLLTTFSNFAARWAPFVNTGWAITLDAVFNLTSNVLSEVYNWTPPAQVSGTNTNAPTRPENFFCYNFRTSGGRKARIFLLSQPGWGYNAPFAIASSTTAGANEALVAYLTGSLTQVVGRDNTKLLAPARATTGINARLRRRGGYA